MRSLSLLLMAWVGVVAVPRADACKLSNSPEAPFVRPTGIDAPLDTHVWVRLPRPRWEHAEATLFRGSARVNLQSVFRWETEHYLYLELAPQAPLRPSSRYHVVIKASGLEDHVTRPFETGTATSEPPVFAGIASARRETNRSSCGAFRVIHVRLRGVPDDGRKAAYAIWYGTSDDTIDYAKPPAQIVWESSTRLLVGDRPGERLKVGIQLLSPAGKASAASEIEVDVEQTDRSTR